MLLGSKVNPKFPKLFEPGYIGAMRLKNRLIRAPMLTCYGTTDGRVTQRIINHYKEMARGGSGLVIVEYAYVDNKASKSAQCQLGATNDEHRPGLEWLASTIKANGAKSCLQLAHAGKANYMGLPPIKAPSRVPWEGVLRKGALPIQELTFDEIVEIVEAFGRAAFRAQQVGFDMIEVHGAHGYLITNFLSPIANRRTDWYGGNLKNRMRFLVEVVENIRQKVGPGFPVSVRLSGTDYEEGGITIDETKEVAKAVERAGASIIHVSGGSHETLDKFYAPIYNPPGNNIWCAEEIKKVVSIPVIGSGSITTPELAEKILEDGKADFVSFGRPFLADPFFPLKAEEGQPEDIRPCIRCGECAMRGVRIGGINCAVNAAVGREEELRIRPADTVKKIAIIGGGPAGMEAARVAALRGHKVTLFEKRKLGGLLLEASTPEFKADLRRLIDYLSTQVRKTGVTVVNSEATSKAIKGGKFDVVIVATGTTPWIPDVRGITKTFVVNALDVLRGAKTGKEVIVVGGGRIACDAALFLAEKGRSVTITTRGEAIAREFNQGERMAFFERLSRYDVKIITGVHLAEVTDSGVVVGDKSGNQTKLKGSSVVLASGLTPDRKLFDELATIPNLKVCAIGDCAEPRSIYDAMHEGFWAAFNLI